MSLERQLRLGRQIRSIGFDDAPFDKARDAQVPIAGVVCANTRFEGLLWGRVERDGLDATEQLLALLKASKFLAQLHLILLDGIAFGGFNVVDLAALSQETGLPAVAVMRKQPRLERVIAAIHRLPDAELRTQRLRLAGSIHQGQTDSPSPLNSNTEHESSRQLGSRKLFFQVQGTNPELAARALAQLCDRGQVPECLRLAHLIGSAVITGQSSKRA
ncbi:MAG: DUF99 family protein [Myxococcota bacterium]|jgi:endonuclease V-like protein UPF0215 family|nr:DUF99 family protein [Myxococcota bacterium]